MFGLLIFLTPIVIASSISTLALIVAATLKFTAKEDSSKTLKYAAISLGTFLISAALQGFILWYTVTSQ